MERSGWLGLCVAITCLVAAPAHGQDSAAQPPAAVAEASADGDTVECMRRLQQNTQRANDARARLVELEAEYSRGITERNLVGDRRVAVVNGIASAKADLATARAAHPMLLAQARQAGVAQTVLDSYPLPPPIAPANPGDAALDAVDSGSSENLDAADTGSSAGLEAVDTGASRDLDAVDDGESASPDPIEQD